MTRCVWRKRNVCVGTTGSDVGNGLARPIANREPQEKPALLGRETTQNKLFDCYATRGWLGLILVPCHGWAGTRQGQLHRDSLKSAPRIAEG